MVKKVAVIGAGLGGLTSAIELAKKGFKVDLYEKNPGTGGKAGVHESKGFVFDTGPSLLTMPFVFQNLLETKEKEIDEMLPVKKLENICKYFFSDGTVFNAYSENSRLLDEFDSKTSDTKDSIDKFLKYCRSMYDYASDLFLFNSLEDVPDIFKKEPLRGLKIISSLDIFRTLHGSHRRFFRDKNTIQLFDRYSTYSGSDPYKIPATLNIIPHVEYGIGAYVPEKGIRAIPAALTDAAIEKGVQIFLDSQIDRIILERDRVKGIEFRGQERGYDIIVSNADVNSTYKDLLNDTSSKMALRYGKMEPSSSAMVFYWGIKEVFEELEVNNIFFSSDYRKEFKEIFKKGISPEEPTVYVNITSKYCSRDAPEGCENWFVLVNVPFDSGQDWAKEVDLVRKRVLNVLKKFTGRDIRALIATEKVMTPKDIYNKTFSNRGSIYGISSNSKLAAFYRQPNRSEKYKGLYFAGGSAHPGGGMPLVALSGSIASKLIVRHET